MGTTLKTPFLAVDVIVEMENQILLIERKNPPHGWALPGGFVDIGESVEDAAIREIKEETGLDVTLEALLGVYSDPQRDPRMHVVSAVFVGNAKGEPKGADDAKRALLFSLDELPSPLAFDHRDILRDYYSYRFDGTLPALKRT